MPLTIDVDLGTHVAAWFTGRSDDPDPAVGRAGNLSARRPHQPDRLARDRERALGRHGVAARDVHLLRQVHGTHVATVGADTPPGAVMPDADAAVTTEPDRPLAVLTADCLPVLLAGDDVVAVAHAGRRGLLGGVLQATVAACRDTAGDAPLRAAIGPAIHGCCYEVPAAMRDEAVATHPDAGGATTWGTPSLDLPRVAARVLDDLGVAVEVVATCTRCDADQWFSHRADPQAGRQAGVVVRRGAKAAA